MPRRVPLADITTYLDALLRIREVPDSPNAVNGLEVQNGGTVTRIVAAVDSSQAAIDSAGEGALLLVHHGVFWDGNIPATGRRYRRLKALIERDVALYAAHIPLDVHPEFGNNAALARMLGMSVQGWFGQHLGIPIGVWGALTEHRDQLRVRLDQLLGTKSRLIAGGPERTARIGIITGAGGSAIAEAREAGLDTFVTGEGAHHTYFDAIEGGINLIYAGHYATETVGVQALAEHLSARFDLPWEFFRHDTGL